jgi:hypothetical protein
MTTSALLSTETLADGDMVPLGFNNTLGSSADTLPIEFFEHRRFLRVDRGVRENPQQCKGVDHTGEKCLDRWCY